MTNRLQTDKPNQHRAVAGTLAAALAVLILSTVPAGATPTLNSKYASPVNAPPNTLVSVSVTGMFNNAGTNPRFRSVSPSTRDYHTAMRMGPSDNTRYFVQAKSNADLRALFPQPSNPFTVTVSFEMTNNEGQSATATLSFKTQWDNRAPSGWPTLKRSSASAPPDVEVSAFPEYFFSNAGTNPQFSNVTFSTMDYYADSSGIDSGILFVRAKSEEDLNDLDSPPDSPFSVAVTVQMTNDEGRIGTGTIDYTTTYTRDEDE